MAIPTTSFEIKNNTTKKMIIVHEPEYWEFMLPPNEEVTIEVDSCEDSIALWHSYDDDQIVIRVLGDKSYYRVMYKGKDVFEEYYD